MNIYDLWAISTCASGIYGFQKGKGTKLSKTVKGALIYSPIIVGTVASVYFGDEIFNRFVTQLLKINHGDFESIRPLVDIYYLNKPMVYTLSAVGTLAGGSIGALFGYLTGKRIGKKFNANLESRIK